MPDQPEGGSDKKIAGLPRTPALIGIAAIGGTLIYLWIKKKNTKGTATGSTTTVITGSTSSSTGISGSMLNAILKDWQEHPESASGGTTSTTSKTTAEPTSKTTTPAKKPPGKTPVEHPGTPKSFKTITVKKGQTLDELAKEYGISPAELAKYNVYVAGEAPGKKAGTPLGTGAGLKTGQKLKVPVY